VRPEIDERERHENLFIRWRPGLYPANMAAIRYGARILDALLVRHLPLFRRSVRRALGTCSESFELPRLMHAMLATCGIPTSYCACPSSVFA